jgi:hypothetical protein
MEGGLMRRSARVAVARVASAKVRLFHSISRHVTCHSNLSAIVRKAGGMVIA